MTIEKVYSALQRGGRYEDIIPYYSRQSYYTTQEIAAATFKMVLESLPLPPEDEALRFVREVLTGEAWDKLHRCQEVPF